jgi:hypothetical protein
VESYNAEDRWYFEMPLILPLKKPQWSQWRWLEASECKDPCFEVKPADKHQQNPSHSLVFSPATSLFGGEPITGTIVYWSSLTLYRLC